VRRRWRLTKLGAVILHSLELDAHEFEAMTGWAIEPEGACRADVCVPLGGGPFELVRTAERLGMPLVHDPDLAVWALGPSSLSGRALASALAPELVLPDLAGRPFSLASLRGRKVVLVAWAPY
jgi:hypothetical protein